MDRPGPVETTGQPTPAHPPAYGQQPYGQPAYPPQQYGRTSRRTGVLLVAGIGVLAVLLPVLILVARSGDSAPAAAAAPVDHGTALTAAVEDIRGFWQQSFEPTFGEPYQDVTKVDAYTEADPPQTECGSEYSVNAFYCSLDHSISYDDQVLIPSFFDKYGAVGPAVVLAHEWGHAVSFLGGILDFESSPVFVGEQQADCFAGSWLKQAIAAGTLGYTPDQLDSATAAILDLRDPVGSSPDHGTAFDRAGAFQEGFDFGVGRCATYSEQTLQPIVLEGTGDETTQLPLEEAVEVHTAGLTAFSAALPGGEQTISWENTSGRALPCGGAAVPLERGFAVCPERAAVGYDGAVVRDLTRFGDFAPLGVLGAHTFAALAAADGTDVGSTSPRRWDCLVGAYARAAYDGQLPEVELAAGDLDELVGGLLVTDSQPAGTAVSGLGFERLASVRSGFLGGPDFCNQF